KNHAWRTLASRSLVAAFVPRLCTGDLGRLGLDHESAAADPATSGPWAIGSVAYESLGRCAAVLAALAGQFGSHGYADRVGARSGQGLDPKTMMLHSELT